MSMKTQPAAQTFRIGVIGCGHWGKNYVRTFASLPGTTLTAVADVAPDKLAMVNRSYPGVATFEDYRHLLASGLCDAVVVATVASTHYQVVKDALKAGMDVLAEKPFTLTVAEADDLIGLISGGDRIVMVAHTFLFNPSILRIKKLIEEGVLGNVYYIKARRTHLGLIREDVNAIWDLAPHDISIFLYLLGESPSTVQAVGRRVLKANRVDAAFINMTFPSGVIANIHVSWADSNKERFVDITGSKSRIVFDDLNIQEPVRIFYKGVSVETNDPNIKFNDFKYLFRDGDILSPKIPVQEPLRVLCEAFIDCVRTRKQPFSDARLGRDVVDVLCRIEAALKANPKS